MGETALVSRMVQPHEPALPSRERTTVGDDNSGHRFLPSAGGHRTADTTDADTALLEHPSMRYGVASEVLRW